MSSMLAPASRFSNTADTGIRVSRKTHAPPSRPGTLSTAEHRDQSSAAIRFHPLNTRYHSGQGGATPARRKGRAARTRPAQAAEIRREEQQRSGPHTSE